MEQPNVTSDGDAALTPIFWLLAAATGVATGLCGDGLMWILRKTQHLAYGSVGGGFLGEVRHASDLRRVVACTLAGLIGGVCWYLIRRYLATEQAGIDDALWSGDGELSARRSALTSIVSEVVVGLGASMGREAAPKLMGGVAGSVLAKLAHLSPAQRRLLVACGGGAGLAAVYNVPLAGALFAAEILYGSLALPIVLPALACSVLATWTAWIALPSHATYLNIPHYRLTVPLLVFAAVIGPVVGLVSVGYVRGIGWISHHRVQGAWILVAFPITLFVLGLVAIPYPQLLGNGQDIAHSLFLSEGDIGLLIALALLKPLATVLNLGAGGTGGLLTPTLATGALLGGIVGIGVTHASPGTPMGALALCGGAAMCAAAMQAPLTALVLVPELTGGQLPIIVPMILAATGATVVARIIDGYSIYSARLSAI
jgi:chloride channel protein, CIC family